MIFRINWCLDVMSRLLKRIANDETYVNECAVKNVRCLHKRLPVIKQRKSHSQEDMPHSHKRPREICSRSSRRTHSTSRLKPRTTFLDNFMMMLKNMWFRVNKMPSVLTFLGHSVLQKLTQRKMRHSGKTNDHGY